MNEVSWRIVNEIQDVSRVVYDISGKLPNYWVGVKNISETLILIGFSFDKVWQISATIESHKFVA